MSRKSIPSSGRRFEGPNCLSLVKGRSPDAGSSDAHCPEAEAMDLDVVTNRE